jgi:hypothetical protein
MAKPAQAGTDLGSATRPQQRRLLVNFREPLDIGGGQRLETGSFEGEVRPGWVTLVLNEGELFHVPAQAVTWVREIF